MLADAATLFGDRALDLAVLGLAAAVAGVINSMAGGGSFLTLPLLAAFGVPAGTASGTIRVGILFQNASILVRFRRSDVTPGRAAWLLAVPMCVGAIGGAYAATLADDAVLEPVFGAIFLVWAVGLLARPGRFFRRSAEPRSPTPATYLLALVIGVYGGFVQAGIGFVLLALFVTHLGHDPIRANAMKVAVVLVYTSFALAIFALAGKIAWGEAFVLAGGGIVGGWIGAHTQLKLGPDLIRWVVIVMVTISGGSMIVRAVLG